LDVRTNLFNETFDQSPLKLLNYENKPEF
jgi:hypothetical protein